MIKVDCREIESIKHKLSIYVSDKVEAIPTLKSHEFVLSPIDDDKKIDPADVLTSISEFLYSIGEAKNFLVMAHENVILIKSSSKNLP